MKMDGVPITFGLIQGKIQLKMHPNQIYYYLHAGVWAGHFAKDHCKIRNATPELFLYSNNDYYLSFQYLEKMVLGKKC